MGIEEGTPFTYPYIDWDIDAYLVGEDKKGTLSKEQMDVVRNNVHYLLKKYIDENLSQHIETAIMMVEYSKKGK